jgi:hypothetical protein
MKQDFIKKWSFMRSKVIERIAADTYRKVNYCVDAYAKFLLSGIRQRFNYYFDWKSFNIGIGFCKTTGISGWKYMLSFDIGFFSCWIFLVKMTKE